MSAGVCEREQKRVPRILSRPAGPPQLQRRLRGGGGRGIRHGRPGGQSTARRAGEKLPLDSYNTRS